MPFNVINVKLANKKGVLVSGELVDFDKDGLGTIQDEGIYKSVLELANFFPAEEQPEKEEAPDEEEPSEDEKKAIEDSIEDDSEGEELPDEEEKELPNFDSMTHAQLDAYAKENLESMEDYPKSGDKKEKIDFLTKAVN